MVYFSYKGNKKWIDILDNLVSKYNNKKHSSIGVSPNDASNNPELVKNEFNKVGENSNTVFNVGDKVYIYKWKDKFEKGRKGYWKISEKFKIKEVKKTNPLTYIIEDTEGNEILGSFYSNQLIKI